jgi:hypothetical protein
LCFDPIANHYDQPIKNNHFANTALDKNIISYAKVQCQSQFSHNYIIIPHVLMIQFIGGDVFILPTKLIMDSLLSRGGGEGCVTFKNFNTFTIMLFNVNWDHVNDYINFPSNLLFLLFFFSCHLFLMFSFLNFWPHCFYFLPLSLGA